MKQLLVLLSVIFFISCSDKPKFTERLIERNVQNCEDNCLAVNFTYLFCKKPSKFAENFNKEIEKQIVNFLLFGEMEELKEKNITMTQAIDIFMQDYQKQREIFPEMIPYELMLNDTISFQNDKIISLISKRYSYTGGVTSYSFAVFLNFDVSNGNLISNNELFTDEVQVAKIAQKYFEKEVKVEREYRSDFWFEDGQFRFPNNVGISSEHLILFYNPYELPPYINVSFEVKIPIEEVKPFLKHFDHSPKN